MRIFCRLLALAVICASYACTRTGIEPGVLPASGTGASLAAASAYRVLYTFKGGTDGYYPASSLVAVNGALYGTTLYGGGPKAQGIVFKITLPSGKESILYRFKGGADGSEPTSALAYFNGELYGTTVDGGDQSPPCSGACGTVFAVSLTGHKRTVHAFTSGLDGAGPTSGLVLDNGKLYGETGSGGCSASQGGDGTIYTISSSGAESVISKFNCPTTTYGPVSPTGGLVPYKGSLYGVTPSGGVQCPTMTTCGTFFRVSPNGSVKFLYSFRGGRDGKQPYGVAQYHGTFYGTTEFGGNNAGECGGFGCGVVFAISLSGSERVIYKFRGNKDGFSPRAAPIALGSMLYGTTAYGGGTGCTTGCGTLYSVTPSGSERVLHAFIGNSDGSTPIAAPYVFGKSLYGTAVELSGSGSGGIVYQFTP